MTEDRLRGLVTLSGRLQEHHRESGSPHAYKIEAQLINLRGTQDQFPEVYWLSTSSGELMSDEAFRARYPTPPAHYEKLLCGREWRLVGVALTEKGAMDFLNTAKARYGYDSLRYEPFSLRGCNELLHARALLCELGEQNTSTWKRKGWWKRQFSKLLSGLIRQHRQ